MVLNISSEIFRQSEEKLPESILHQFPQTEAVLEKLSAKTSPRRETVKYARRSAATPTSVVSAEKTERRSTAERFPELVPSPIQRFFFNLVVFF